jgi:nucleotide-binding universal stress UspA family protein
MAQPVRIIAPTDFSPAADRATRRAASLASSLGGALHLIHVLPPDDVLEELFPPSSASEAASLRKRAEHGLQERAKRLADRFRIAAECSVVQGYAHQAILDASDSLGGNVIVLGAQGESEGALPSQAVGDTALKVAGHSRVAVLLVRSEALFPYAHVVACVKAVPADGPVIDWANRITPNDLLHVASAYTVPYQRRLAEWGASSATLESYAARERDERTRKLSDLLRKIGLHAARARLHVERGEPLEVILKNAASWKADLLIVGRREQANPLAAGPLGSVARHIAFLAPVDVMIVPPESSS